jgi:bifunctional DNase/RNase
MRAGVPIVADEDVLTEAGLLIPDENGDEDAPAEAKEDEVEKFKEFLDNVSPDDFKASGGA